MKRVLLALGLLIASLQIGYAATITCPTLTCDEVLLNDLCYVHSSDGPVTTLKMFKGDGDKVGDFEDNGYAWVNSNKQEFSESVSPLPSNSQVYFKRTEFQCKNPEIYNVNLNAGQKGGEDVECKSLSGFSSKCTGRSEGYSGFEHSDCGVKLAGISDTTYPFATKGKTWLTSGSGTDDFDGSPEYFCWYASSTNAASSTKTGLQKFSLATGTTFGWSSVNSDPVKDGLLNGQHCTTGFAYESATDTATCAEIIKIESDLGEVETPYKCTATDTTNMCKYYYDASNFVESQGQCGLDGESGYCPMPGQTELSKLVSAIETLDQDFTCHTLDRYNYRGIRRSGCLNTTNHESKTTVWKTAASENYTISNWPFIQGTNVSVGMENTFYTSVTNIQI